MPPSPVAPFPFGLGLAYGGEQPRIPASVEAWVPADHAGAVEVGFLSRLRAIHGPDRALRLFAEPEPPKSWRVD